MFLIKILKRDIKKSLTENYKQGYIEKAVGKGIVVKSLNFKRQ